MKTLIRSLILLALATWVGAELFFPVMAGVTFTTLMPDTHTAGMIVGICLRILHYVGLGCGLMALLLFAVSPNLRVWSADRTTTPMLVLIIMMSLTVLSQWGITPRMEHDRMEAGGSFSLIAPDAPIRLHFNRLHQISTWVEGGILFGGILMIFLIARIETRTQSES